MCGAPSGSPEARGAPQARSLDLCPNGTTHGMAAWRQNQNATVELSVCDVKSYAYGGARCVKVIFL